MSKESLVTEIENTLKNKESLDTKDIMQLMKKTGLGFKQISTQCKLIKKRMDEKKKEEGENFKSTRFLSEIIDEAKNSSSYVEGNDYCNSNIEQE